MNMITSAFTCTGPYAILIMLGIKRVENRSSRPIADKARFAVSCSKSFSKEEFGSFVHWAAKALPEEDFSRIPAWSDVQDRPGKIVGACDLEVRDGLVTQDAALPLEGHQGALRPTMWNEGYRWWWGLSEVATFESQIPCRGNVGVWQLDELLAARVTAADALARSVGTRIATREDATRLFRIAMSILPKGSEGFFVLPLDDAGAGLSEPVLVSVGETHTTVVSPEEVFSAALKVGAKSIIVAHNHPGGDLTPSAEDHRFTAAIKSLGETLGIKLVDHLIIGTQSCQ